MHYIIAAALAVTACASVAQAQTVDPEIAGPILTLEQALALAGATSPSLEAAAAGVRASVAARSSAGLRPNPTIVTQMENIAGSGQYQGVRSAETTGGLELPIELGGKRSARIAVANAKGTKAQLVSAIAAADLRLTVTQAYLDAVAAERRLITAREQVAIANEGLRAARVRVRAGRASPIEEQRADVLRINAETAFERGERTVLLARGNLARRIGQPVTHVLDGQWFDGVANYGPALSIEARDTLALAAAQADLTTADAQIRLAQSQRIPDITLSASTRRIAATNNTVAVLGVSLPFPVFNSGRAAVDQARAERDQSEAQRRMIELDMIQAIAAADAEVANAATTARAANGPAMAAAVESARIARIGYREGKFGQLDLLDAERTLSDTRTAAIDALVGYHDAQARRDRLTTAAPDITKD